MRGNKKGQFYLATAIIIIAIILGFSAVSNFAKERTTITLYDLQEELQIESESVLDFGTFNNQDMNALLEDFITRYTEYAGEGKELLFVFGDEDGVSSITYDEVTKGSVSVNIGSEQVGQEIRKREYKKEPRSLTEEEKKEEKIHVEIKDTDYNFKLTPGQNFYFVISQEVEGEQYVVKN